MPWASVVTLPEPSISIAEPAVIATSAPAAGPPDAFFVVTVKVVVSPTRRMSRSTETQIRSVLSQI
jgi:hypothetical protein